jgi:hypothetical protein
MAGDDSRRPPIDAFSIPGVAARFLGSGFLFIINVFGRRAGGGRGSLGLRYYGIYFLWPVAIIGAIIIMLRQMIPCSES